MLVYRVVPGYWGVRLTSGYLAASSEDAFYDLGYLNIQKGGSYFNTGDFVNSFAYNREECKYFFLFPWDALLNSKYMMDDMEINILEYDIPQKLLIECLGFGYYDGWKIPEFRIPLSMLRNNNPIFQECDDEVINKLLGVFQRRAQVFFERIKPFLMQRLNTQKISQQRYEYIEKKMQETNQAELLNIYKTRLEHLGTFFKCEYITGRYALFFGNDIKKIRYSTGIQNVINDSLLFLTNDTYQEWIDYWKAIQDPFVEGNKSYIIQNYLNNDKGRMLIK